MKNLFCVIKLERDETKKGLFLNSAKNAGVFEIKDEAYEKEKEIKDTGNFACVCDYFKIPLKEWDNMQHTSVNQAGKRIWLTKGSVLLTEGLHFEIV